MAMTSAGARKKALDDALENTLRRPIQFQSSSRRRPQRIATGMLSGAFLASAALPTQQSRGQVDAGRKTMNTSERFLRFAAECEFMAQFTHNPKNKTVWSDMAERWLRCVCCVVPLPGVATLIFPGLALA